MYNFIDTTEYQSAALLPSEALKINGTYIEDLIDGYRTLYVIGRESIITEIESFEIGVKDGAEMKHKKYPARPIIVGYQLLAKSNEAFREAYNILNGILNVEEAQLIFRDEQDKFFIGTPVGINEIEPGTNYVKGEIEFCCLDPFKYSTKEYEVEAGEDNEAGLSFVIDYKGTHRSYPRFETKFFNENEAQGDTVEPLLGKGDCGYVAFFNEHEKIIQFGDPEEIDGVYDDAIKAQTLVNQDFDSSDAWGSAAKELWKVNAGKTISDVTEQVGNVGIKKVTAMYEKSMDFYSLEPSNYGSGSGWHGPSITRKIPNDASGRKGASNFCYSFAAIFSNYKETGGSDSSALGSFQTLLLDDAGNVVAGMQVLKNIKGMYATVRFYINGALVDSMQIHMSPHFNLTNYEKDENRKWSSITKSGNKVTFAVSSQLIKTYLCTDEGFSEQKTTQVTYSFAQYGTNTPLEANGLYGIKFVKNNCDTWSENPNKFSSNDLLIVNCEDGEVLLNGVTTPALGALGNDWEEFYLKPGINQIGVALSEWLTAPYLPKIKVKYREVFL